MGLDTLDVPPVGREPVARRPSCVKACVEDISSGTKECTYVVCTAAKIKLFSMLELISHTREDVAHQSSNMPM